MYDFLIVGAGLFGAVCANLLTSAGKKVLVVEKKSVVGGACYTENIRGITVHKYGPHIFKTNNADIWKYVNNFCQFKPFINTPIAIHNGEAYNLPFNMNTFAKLWNITTPEQAIAIINQQVKEVNITNPKNLEEFALSTVGYDIYNKFIKEYTEKQWNKKCVDLPQFIIKRIPLRFTYDNNYFTTVYQGIPVKGYTYLIEKLLAGSDVLLNTDGKAYIKNNANCAHWIIYTGPIDEYYDYSLGRLDYRSLRFEHKIIDKSNVQGVAVVNYSDKEIPYTRSTEHCHFLNQQSNCSVVSYEYPINYDDNVEPYYPVNDEKNNALYLKYVAIDPTIIFAGRLGGYEYSSMDDTIMNARLLCKQFIKGEQI